MKYTDRHNHSILEELEEKALMEHIPIIRKTERQILKKALEQAKPNKILEIGTAWGYSALLMAEWCPWACIDTLELDQDRAEKAREYIKEAGCQDRIRCIAGDAAHTIPQMQGPYDFLYLDGPKGQYLRHMKAVEPLLSARAVTAADNVLFRGWVEGTLQVPRRFRTIAVRMRAYVAYMKGNYETDIYPDGDGMMIAWRKKTE